MIESAMALNASAMALTVSDGSVSGWLVLALIVVAPIVAFLLAQRWP